MSNIHTGAMSDMLEELEKAAVDYQQARNARDESAARLKELQNALEHSLYHFYEELVGRSLSFSGGEVKK